MTNPYYNNTTNTILDGTSADASDIENKCNDIVAGFDLVEASAQASGLINITDTTKGKLLAANGSRYVDFPVGTDGQIIVADSTETQGAVYGGHNDIADLQGGAAGEYNHLTDDELSDLSVSKNNVLINGLHEIKQRTLGVVTSGEFMTDRWNLSALSSSGVFTASVNSDTPTSAQLGVGSNQSLQLTVSTADASIGAGEYVSIQQKIEGYMHNLIDAQEFTVSFWCKGSEAETLSVGLRNNPVVRSYVHEFAVTTDWTKVEFTVTHDTVGTWLTDNSLSMYFTIALACGSNFQASSADAWESSNNIGTTGITNGIGTLGQWFRFTDLRITPGKSTTSMSHRDYAREELLCFRYYYLTTQNTAVFTGAATNHTTQARCNYHFPTPMRTSPSITFNGTSNMASETTAWIGQESALFHGAATSATLFANLTSGIELDSEL